MKDVFQERYNTRIITRDDVESWIYMRKIERIVKSGSVQLTDDNNSILMKFFIIMIWIIYKYWPIYKSKFI